MRERKDERTPKSRRVPLGRLRSKLSAPERKGYRRRWMNDDNNRLLDAEKAGYTYVLDREKEIHVGDSAESTNSDLGSRVSKVVDHIDGRPIKAYLMEIPEKYYNEDFAAKMAEVDKIDHAIRHGDNQIEKGYIPKSGIKYDS